MTQPVGQIQADLEITTITEIAIRQKIGITPRAAPDTRLELSQVQQIIIGISFLLLLPLALFGSGLTIWLKRRNR